MSFCTKCGAEMPDDSRFCTKCGQAVSGGDNPYASNLTTDNVAYAAGVGSAGPMTFGQAVSTCFSKYATFKGRARRAEYWYFYLFCFIVNFVLNILSRVVADVPALVLILGLAQLSLTLPTLAVTARRLHDRGNSGWFQLAPGGALLLGSVLILVAALQRSTEISPVGIAGLVCFGVGIALAIILLVRLARIGEPGENKYGPDPLEA